MWNDTCPQALAVYLQRLAEMTPSEKLHIGHDLWDAGDRRL
jgi:hypothetical protein